MPTILSHPAVPLAIALGLGQRVIPVRLLIAGVIASILPDLDVVGLHLGVDYASALGHRGFSHSLLFAAFIALAAGAFASELHTTRRVASVFIFASAASHGLLDMLTNGGLGVALWWPFSDERLFFPWQPVEVSPLSLQRFLSSAGLAVLKSELVWVWLPAAAVCAALALLGRRHEP